MPLLEVTDLSVAFASPAGEVTALDSVSFAIGRGEILGLVGESGAGKSLTGSAIIGLLAANARLTGGEIRFEGRRIDGLPEREMRRLRGARIGAIFQDPLTTLSPVHTVGQQLVRTIRTHRGLNAGSARREAVEWMRQVGIPAATERVDAYPHEFSGGMRQRIVIALALCSEPGLVIADEPTTALDVSVQAQVLALLKRLVRERGISVLLVTHDMGVIATTADRLAVMYAGRIVEIGATRQVVTAPAHPYSRGLMASIPPLDRKQERLFQIDGVMPSLDAIPAGCAFHPRCSEAFGRCRAERPALREGGGISAACWLHPQEARADA